ncbi:hypothetical protein D3C73_736040 [compost metagenome]
MPVIGGRFYKRTHFAQDLQLIPFQILAEDLNASRSRFNQPQQHADGGCFARTVGPKEAVDFPFAYIQIQMLHRSPATVFLQ